MSFGKTNYRTGGTRGGADQFKWDDVKNDKYRENYLGHSMHAPVGRWQKGKDLTWYAKTSKEQRALELREELQLAKQRDEDLMNQALGLAPRRREEPTGDLEANELKELLRRGDADRDGLVGERIEGIGAAPVGSSAILDGSNAAPKKTKTLAERYKDQLASGLPDTTHALPGTIHITTEAGSDAVSSSRTATGASGVVCKRDNETKEERRARKAALKAAKKAKKHAKKAAKRAKRKDEERSDSDSDSDEDIDKRGRSQSPRSSRQARQLTRSRSDSRRRSHERRSFDQRRSSRRSRSRSLERRHSSRRSSYRRSRSRSYSPRRSDRQRDSDRHREHRHDDYASRRR